ncbi:hypothetical protein HPB48_026891 [Haemaphysalis longicornis]|uniref:Uncharacterized protein n=1 Tax=Haemaphysalis longicornis TaxID=44386 RepID=A0A9J6HAM8_HAELO|nr:hypothetical protein HPB48_026891 [Haemaphysalis longicornis]
MADGGGRRRQRSRSIYQDDPEMRTFFGDADPLDEFETELGGGPATPKDDQQPGPETSLVPLTMDAEKILAQADMLSERIKRRSSRPASTGIESPNLSNIDVSKGGSGKGRRKSTLKKAKPRRKSSKFRKAEEANEDDAGGRVKTAEKMNFGSPDTTVESAAASSGDPTSDGRPSAPPPGDTDDGTTTPASEPLRRGAKVKSGQNTPRTARRDEASRQKTRERKQQSAATDASAYGGIMDFDIRNLAKAFLDAIKEERQPPEPGQRRKQEESPSETPSSCSKCGSVLFDDDRAVSESGACRACDEERSRGRTNRHRRSKGVTYDEDDDEDDTAGGRQRRRTVFSSNTRGTRGRGRFKEQRPNAIEETTSNEVVEIPWDPWYEYAMESAYQGHGVGEYLYPELNGEGYYPRPEDAYYFGPGWDGWEPQQAYPYGADPYEAAIPPAWAPFVPPCPCIVAGVEAPPNQGTIVRREEMYTEGGRHRHRVQEILEEPTASPSRADTERDRLQEAPPGFIRDSATPTVATGASRRPSDVTGGRPAARPGGRILLDAYEEIGPPGSPDRWSQSLFPATPARTSRRKSLTKQGRATSESAVPRGEVLYWEADAPPPRRESQGAPSTSQELRWRAIDGQPKEGWTYGESEGSGTYFVDMRWSTSGRAAKYKTFSWPSQKTAATRVKGSSKTSTLSESKRKTKKKKPRHGKRTDRPEKTRKPSKASTSSQESLSVTQLRPTSEKVFSQTASSMETPKICPTDGGESEINLEELESSPLSPPLKRTSIKSPEVLSETMSSDVSFASAISRTSLKPELRRVSIAHQAEKYSLHEDPAETKPTEADLADYAEGTAFPGVDGLPKAGRAIEMDQRSEVNKEESKEKAVKETVLLNTEAREADDAVDRSKTTKDRGVDDLPTKSSSRSGTSEMEASMRSHASKDTRQTIKNDESEEGADEAKAMGEDKSEDERLEEAAPKLQEEPPLSIMLSQSGDVAPEPEYESRQDMEEILKELEQHTTVMYPESNIVILLAMMCAIWICVVVLLSYQRHGPHKPTWTDTFPTWPADRNMTVTRHPTLTVAPHPRVYLCSTDFCLKEGVYLASLFSRDVSPCDNFYRYVCQHWERTMHGYKSGVGFASSTDTFLEQAMHNRVLKYILSSGSDDVIEAKHLYEACMSVHGSNAATELRQIFSTWPPMLNWPVDKTAVVSVPDVWSVAGRLTRDFGLAALLGVQAALDKTFLQPVLELDLPELIFYRGDDQRNDIDSMFRGAISEAAQLFGSSGMRHELTADVMATFNSIARRRPFFPGVEVKLVPLDSVDADLRGFLSVVFESTLTRNTTVQYRNPAYFDRELAGVFNDAGTRAILNFLGFRLVAHVAPFLPDSDSLLRVHSVESAGRVLSPLAKWVLCLRAVASVLPACAARAHARVVRASGSDVTSRVWMSQLESIFFRSSRRYSWMDSHTHHVVHFMLRRLRLARFYPTWVLRRDLQCADGAPLSGSSPMNMFWAASKAHQSQRLAQLLRRTRPRDVGDAFGTLSRFSWAHQAVYVPFGVVNWSVPSNGSVFALQLSRMAVRLFGGLVPALFEDSAWDETTMLRFSDRSQRLLDELLDCLISDYRMLPAALRGGDDGIVDPDDARNALLVQTAAVHLAHKAFKELLHVKRIWELDFRLLPIPTNSSEQLFFIYFAHDNCERSDEAYRAHRYAALQQLPPEQRVNFPLRHLPAFAEAFHCHRNSPMRAHSGICNVFDSVQPI